MGVSLDIGFVRELGREFVRSVAQGEAGAVCEFLPDYRLGNGAREDCFAFVVVICDNAGDGWKAIIFEVCHFDVFAKNGSVRCWAVAVTQNIEDKIPNFNS